MQLLFDESEEMGRHAGLGVIPAGSCASRVTDSAPLPREGAAPLQETGSRLKVPQIGWNQLHHAGTDPLLAGVPDGAYAYFVHSYYCAPGRSGAHTWPRPTSAIRYASIVRRGNVWGIQCHPEKSQAVGLRILRNFVAIVER